MVTGRPRPQARGMTTPTLDRPVTIAAHPGELRLFFTWTFGLTWGVAGLLLLARPAVEALTGPFSTAHPLYFLAVYAPTLTAIGLTAARRGRAGLRELGSRVLRWRVRPRYAVAVLAGWPAMDLLARLVQQALTGTPPGPALLATTPPTVFGSLWCAPAFLLATLLLDAGPLGEEIGWRGYALPRMLHGRGPLLPAVVLGVVWGLWHLPAFVIAGTHQHDLRMGVLVLVAGTTLTSIMMTWLHLRTHGSVLVSGLLVHLMNNVAVASLWASVIVFTVPAALAAVSLARRTAEAPGRYGPR